MFLDYRRTTIPASSNHSYNIDVSSKISCYKKLTINNFWIQYVNMNGASASLLGNGGYNGKDPFTKVSNIGTYNATTGILTVWCTTSSTTNTLFEASIIAVYIEE